MQSVQKVHGAASAEAAGKIPVWVDRAYSAIGHLTDIAACLLVLAEVGLLFASAVARYLFVRPLIWADELASLLFLWLVVFGSVIALRRGEHMRLTTIIGRLGAESRAWFETLAISLVAVFLVLLLAPVHAYVEDERFIVLPALGLSAFYRVVALEVGVILMIAVLLLRIARNHAVRHLLTSFIVIGMLAAGLYAATPVLAAIGNWNLAIFFVIGVGAMVLAGVPIAFAFGLATLSFLGLLTRSPMTVVLSRMDEGMSHLILLSVPMFVLLGLMVELTGMARAIVGLLASMLGHVRGGLSYVLLGAMYVVSGISGSKAADMAAVAPVLFPEMKQRGCRDGELVALLATSGAMSETIPPSLVLITIGSVTGVSIAALFTGGLMPALVLALALAVVAYWRADPQESRRVPRASLRAIGKAAWWALPALALPFLIRAAVLEGVATATEVSTIGILYTLVAGIVFYRSFDWRRLYPSLVQTAALTGAILLIIGTATAMAWALTQSGFSSDLARAMEHVPGRAAGFMVISIIVFVVLGSVLEGIPAIVLFGPLLFPVARTLGIHEVHYAMVVVLAMGIGLFAPPFGVGYYTACAIGKISPDEGMRAIWVYLEALIIGLAVVAAVPWLSTGFLQ